MTISPLQIMLLGFSDQQHQMLLDELLNTGIPAKLNLLGSDPGLDSSKKGDLANDLVFLYRKKVEQPIPLFRYLHKQNVDCIVVEVLPPDHRFYDDSDQSLLQSCRIIYAPEREEFQLALQFLLRYSLLKKDFRYCKSLLHLSETRVLKLANTSTHAISYLAKGKFVYANIAFLALLEAESLSELARFPLLKLIDPDEKPVLASYLAMINKSEPVDIGLTLSMKKVSGIPFHANLSIAPVVYQNQRCYQMWLSPISLAAKTDVIPVAQALSVWDHPESSREGAEANPFDQILGVSGQGESEKKFNVLLQGVEKDNVAELSFREVYDLKQGPLNCAWVGLDINPDEFKKINLLLARMGGNDKSRQLSENFWEQLLFRRVFDALLYERQLRRVYYMELSVSAIRNRALMDQLLALVAALEDKSQQLKVVFNATVSSDVVPQLLIVANQLRAANCGIVLDNFSVDKAATYLYRELKPECIFVDKYWLEDLKQKSDGAAFLTRFVYKLESHGVSVMLPQTLQKRQDRLLVLSGSSFGQEKTSKGWS